MPDAPLPELARSLRSLGTGRTPCEREAHDAVFGPLLDARMRAVGDSKEKALAALKGASVYKRIETATLAAAQRGVRPDARARAMVAEARELLAPLEKAFAALDASAGSALAGSAKWVVWIAALRLVFAHADLVCEALSRMLGRRDAAPTPRGWFSRDGAS